MEKIREKNYNYIYLIIGCFFVVFVALFGVCANYIFSNKTLLRADTTFGNAEMKVSGDYAEYEKSITTAYNDNGNILKLSANLINRETSIFVRYQIEVNLNTELSGSDAIALDNAFVNTASEYGVWDITTTGKRYAFVSAEDNKIALQGYVFKHQSIVIKNDVILPSELTTDTSELEFTSNYKAVSVLQKNYCSESVTNSIWSKQLDEVENASDCLIYSTTRSSGNYGLNTILTYEDGREIKSSVNGYYVIGVDQSKYSKADSTIRIPETYDDGTNGIMPVIGIGDEAFCALSSPNNNMDYIPYTTKVIIPSKVVGMVFPFATCNNISSVYINPDNAYFSSRDSSGVERNFIRYTDAKHISGTNTKITVTLTHPDLIFPLKKIFINNQDALLYIANSKDIYIPADIKTIWNASYVNEISVNCHVCSSSNIQSIKVDPNNDHFTSQDSEGNECNCLVVLKNGSNATTLVYELAVGCTNTIIPDTAKKIVEGSFCNLTNYNLNIPANITNIDAYAFANTYLSDIVVESTNTTYSSSDANNSYHCVMSANNTKLVLACNKTIVKDGITTFLDGAFISNCSGLTSLIIPSTVTDMGYNARMIGCTNLINLVVDSANTKYTSKDSSGNECNGIFDKTTGELLQYYINTTIPESTTSINSGAFAYLKGVKDFVIPSSITSIDSDSFAYSEVESIYFPSSIVSCSSSYQSFYYCKKINKLIIDSSAYANTEVYSINAGTKVYINSTITTINSLYDNAAIYSKTSELVTMGSSSYYEYIKL